VDPAQLQVPSDRRVDELNGVQSETRDERLAARMRLIGRFDDRRTDGELAPGRDVRQTQIEIDEQLIASQQPATPVSREKGYHP
jgi:hypothetical protein